MVRAARPKKLVLCGFRIVTYFLMAGSGCVMSAEELMVRESPLLLLAPEKHTCGTLVGKVKRCFEPDHSDTDHCKQS